MLPLCATAVGTQTQIVEKQLSCNNYPLPYKKLYSRQASSTASSVASSVAQIERLNLQLFLFRCLLLWLLYWERFTL